jgi:hypothetical protein
MAFVRDCRELGSTDLTIPQILYLGDNGMSLFTFIDLRSSLSCSYSSLIDHATSRALA